MRAIAPVLAACVSPAASVLGDVGVAPAAAGVGAPSTASVMRPERHSDDRGVLVADNPAIVNSRSIARQDRRPGTATVVEEAFGLVEVAHPAELVAEVAVSRLFAP